MQQQALEARPLRLRRRHARRHRPQRVGTDAGDCGEGTCGGLDEFDTDGLGPAATSPPGY